MGQSQRERSWFLDDCPTFQGDGPSLGRHRKSHISIFKERDNMSSLSRGLEILEFVAANQAKGVTYPQILGYTGFPASSCFRVLKELAELNYLNFDEETRKYHVSMKLAGIGASVTRENNMSKLLHPYLERFREESNKTCNLGVMNKDCGMFLDVLYSHNNAIKLLSQIGAPFPLHCTAMGKVLLAYTTQKRRDKILSAGLRPLTDRTITQRTILEGQLAKVRVDGYASEHEESTRGIHCFSAPIFDYQKVNVAAVSVACPYFEFEIPGEPERIIALVKRYAAEMSEVLGYQPN